MTSRRVFVARQIPSAGLDLLSRDCALEVWDQPLPPSADVLRQKLADCDGLLALLTERIDGPLLDAAPRLKVVSNYAVGYNNIDVPACTERGICVGNTPGVLTDATADLALALMMAAARRVTEARDWTLAGNWHTWEPLGHIGQDFAGKTLGIVGMGRIGTAMARRCYGAWGMRVLYVNHSRSEVAERELHAEKVDFDTLLRESDFISVHVDLNDTTRGMFDAAAFAKMKPTCVFINSARGPLVVESALIDALQRRQIFAAGLDVTDPEPSSPDNPLLRLPNCVVVPHIASATVKTRNQMAEIAARNVLAGLRGEPLPGWVNPEVASRRR